VDLYSIGCMLSVEQLFSFEFPRAHREVVRDSNVEIVRDFDSRGRATDVWFRFNNYVVFALEVKHAQLGRIHQWRRKVRQLPALIYLLCFCDVRQTSPLSRLRRRGLC